MPDRKKIKPITLNEMQRDFIEANARLDQSIGEPDALDHFVRDENPRHDENGDDDQAEGVEGKAG